MGLIALVGDLTTTTSLALAAAWPSNRSHAEPAVAELILVELDRSGGSLAAWLDTPSTPSLSTLVAAAPTASLADTQARAMRRAELEPIVQRSRSGLRFVAAPARAREAARAIERIEPALVPLLQSDDTMVALADVGHFDAITPITRAVTASEVTIVVHRQEPSSAAAASVRIDRLTESVEMLGSTGAALVLAVVGDRPFDVAEIADHVASAAGVTLRGACPISVDPLSAMALAGRAGVSPRRLARLPLLRSAGVLADLLAGIFAGGGASTVGDPPVVGATQ